MECWNIGFKPIQAGAPPSFQYFFLSSHSLSFVLPNIPLFQYTAIPVFLSHCSIIPLFQLSVAHKMSTFGSSGTFCKKVRLPGYRWACNRHFFTGGHILTIFQKLIIMSELYSTVELFEPFDEFIWQDLHNYWHPICFGGSVLTKSIYTDFPNYVKRS